MSILSVCALLFLLLFLAAERVLLSYARKQFSLVIHVNGTRGKSTVTRMIHALLRKRGMEVYGKTTGSAASFLLPDGTERPVRRFGPANVREQRNMMLLSAYLSKRAFFKKEDSPIKRRETALVFECNAVQEELQRISAKWLAPDITVITNVREDHVGELGTAGDAALAFMAAIPANSALVTSESQFTAILETAAKQKKFIVRYVDPALFVTGGAGSGEFPANIACVMGVAEHLGMERTEALEAIKEYKPDAGAFGLYSWTAASHPVFFADARAANDVKSTEQLLVAASRAARPETGSKCIFLLVNREDRPDRTWQFLQYITARHRDLPFSRYLCLGQTPLSFLRKMKREGLDCKVLANIHDLDKEPEETGENSIYIFAAGNYGGKGRQITLWLEEKRQVPDFRQRELPL